MVQDVGSAVFELKWAKSAIGNGQWKKDAILATLEVAISQTYKHRAFFEFRIFCKTLTLRQVA